MKIAIFTDTFLPQINGVTNTLSRFGDYLTKSGIEYIFLTPDHPLKDNHNYNIEKLFSTRFIFYPECRFAIPNMLRINQILDQFKPDLIQLMTEFNVGLSGMVYAKKHNIPYITNFSTNYEDILTAYNMGILKKTMWRYCKKFHSQAVFTLTPSKETQKFIYTKGITRTKLFTRGIDFERFHPNHRSHSFRKFHNIEDKIVLLYVGRVSPEKGLSILRESMIRLDEKYPGKIALIVTGEGPMLEDLKTTMPKNVIFTGYKQGHELAQIYASSDIFAFPSGFETFGNVVLEAMASGIPAVGVSKGGVMESIIPHRNGLLAQPDDADSFTQQLEEMIQNDEMRCQLGKRARKFAETRSWDSIFKELMESYEEVLLDQQINVSSF